MSEAIISRRGSTSKETVEFRTEVIAGNSNWEVPKTIKNNIISVRIFGAGGCDGASGGSGWMNNAEIPVVPGQIIPVTIGRCNLITNGVITTGGSSSFGTYLSANGGTGNSGGAGVGSGTGYQFGGGGGGDRTNWGAGDGGIWGGGGGGGRRNSYAGNGGRYGGGGGSSVLSEDKYYKGTPAGNGGEYGGGGGSGGRIYIRYRINNTIERDIYDLTVAGKGGMYGGNGGTLRNNSAMAGTNTIGNPSIPKELQGPGISGSAKGHKYAIITKGQNTNKIEVFGDGGGGFGGCGGIGGGGTSNFINASNESALSVIISGGGGGGYGSNGGNGTRWYMPSSGDFVGGGGGGGYGGKGADGGIGYSGGGGGYFSDAIENAGGGYYNYCRGYIMRYDNGINTNNAMFSYGSGHKDGACIVQYYI